jgi:tetratricopeptide (TPR) repeat protein
MNDYLMPLLLVVAGVSSIAGPSVSRAWHRHRRVASLMAKGQYRDAEVLLRELLVVANRRHGTAHWRTALVLAQIAQCLLLAQSHEQARPLLERAMNIVDAYGEPLRHPELMFVTLMAACYEDARGNEARCASLIERARLQARGRRELLLRVEQTRAHIAMVHGRVSEALDALARLDPADLDRANLGILMRFALERLRAGDPELAQRLYSAVVPLLQRRAPRAFSTAFFRGLLGEALALSGRDDEAGIELERAIAAHDRIAGARHPAVVTPLLVLAEVRLRLGDAEKARAACERVLAFEAATLQVADAPYRKTDDDLQPLRAELDRARTLLARATSAPS